LGRHLGAGKHAAMAGLGALAQLDLDHLDLRVGCRLGEALGREAAIGVAAAEIAAAQLPDDVAAELSVIAAVAALAGIVSEAAEFRASVEGADCVGAQGAEAHRRDVEERDRVRLPALRTADGHAEIAGLDLAGGDRMVDPLEVVAIDVLLRAEGALVESPLGALIDDRALRPVEGRAVGVALEEVLADLGTDLLEREADIGEDRVVAAEAVPPLHEIPDAERGKPGTEQREDEEGAAERDQQREDRNPGKRDRQ